MAKDLAPQIAIVEEALVDIRESTAKNASPKLRAVRAKLETYERVVEGWQRRSPSEEQCSTLLECVMELHDEVFGRAPNGAHDRARSDPRASVAPPAPPESARPTRPAPEGPLPDEARPTSIPTSPPVGAGQRSPGRPDGRRD